MGLLLFPQCCCGVPGFFRFGANYAIIDPSRVDGFGCLVNSGAPWMYYDGCGSLFGGFGGGEYGLLGYDSHRDRLFASTGVGFLGSGIYNTGTHRWEFPSSAGGVVYCVLSNVVDGAATWLKEAGEWVELISDVDGQAILDDSDPTANNPTSIVHAWSDYSEGRLYGYTRWVDDDDYHFKAWSVKTDGTDYTEHFDLSVDKWDTDVSVPATMAVHDGHIYTHERFFDGVWKYRYRRDGVNVAEMEQGAITYGTGTQGIVPFAQIEVDNQVVSLSYGIDNIAPNTPLIVLVADGTDDLSQQLQFVASEDEVDVEYYPQRIGWDERARAVVILWLPALPVFPGDLPSGNAYVTYHTRALDPGNILTQLDYVKVYAAMASGGPWWGKSDYNFGVVIPGKMPPPLTVTGRVIEPPPPPPPEPNSCDDLDSCVDLEAVGEMRFVEDVTEGSGTDIYGRAYDSATWYYTNFSRLYDCVLLSGTVPSGPATGWATSYQYNFWCNLTNGQLDDYNNPGILLQSFDYTLSRYHREQYVTDVLFGVDCVDGELIIKQLLLWRYDWVIDTDAGDPWPPVGFNPYNRSPLLFTQIDMLEHASPGYVTDDGCIATMITSMFLFDNFDSTTVGDRFMGASLQIGPLA